MECSLCRLQKEWTLFLCVYFCVFNQVLLTFWCSVLIIIDCWDNRCFVCRRIKSTTTAAYVWWEMFDLRQQSSCSTGSPQGAGNHYSIISLFPSNLLVYIHNWTMLVLNTYCDLISGWRRSVWSHSLTRGVLQTTVMLTSRPVPVPQDCDPV